MAGKRRLNQWEQWLLEQGVENPTVEPQSIQTEQGEVSWVVVSGFVQGGPVRKVRVTPGHPGQKKFEDAAAHQFLDYIKGLGDKPTPRENAVEQPLFGGIEPRPIR